MALTIRNVVDLILKDIPGAPFDDTVDTFKSGDPDQEVTGIVTTFLASQDVIRRAAELGANFIIAHEPTFYNHRDQVDWLEEDPVYRAKRALLDKHAIVVWRFHDYWHSAEPDGIMAGVVARLGWESYLEKELPIFNIPPMTVGQVVQVFKDRLGAKMARVVGDPEMECRRVALFVGMAGGTWQISFLSHQDVDMMVAGEIDEWETSEYVRDAVIQGRKLALAVIGHVHSEEAGMEWLVGWLQQRFPTIPVTHVPVGDAFRYL